MFRVAWNGLKAFIATIFFFIFCIVAVVLLVTVPWTLGILLVLAYVFFLFYKDFSGTNKKE